jgi:hypothetical protein
MFYVVWLNIQNIFFGVNPKTVPSANSKLAIAQGFAVSAQPNGVVRSAQSH